jgi:maleamate amidohydrolase
MLCFVKTPGTIPLTVDCCKFMVYNMVKSNKEPDMKYILLVIDMQKDFFSHNVVLAEKKPSLAASINTLLDNCRNAEVPAAWVTVAFEDDLSDAFLVSRRNNIRQNIKGTEGCQIIDELSPSAGDFRIVKKRYSAFFRTGLEEILKDLGVDTVLLAGINTHACIRIAAIDAYQRDYDVILASDCIASYDEEFHRETLRYLTGYIAKALSNDEIKEILNNENRSI